VSGGVAHADPGFVLSQSEARAGDAVQFSITGAEGSVEYDIEVNDRDVAKGEAPGNVSGQFTMPNFGSSPKSVTVEAEIEDEDDETKVYRKLQYLGPAVAVTGPAGTQPAAAAAPAAPPQPAAPSQPAHTPQAAAVPAASAPVVKQRSKRRARHKRKRTKSERRRGAHRIGGSKSRRRPSRRRNSAAEKTRPKRLAPRTAPLFDGVPEPGARSRPPGGKDRPVTVRAKVAEPPAAKLATTRVDAGRSAMAVLVPALLAFASLALASTALLRKRRLASEEDRAGDSAQR
jgi:hypothetical protein